MTCKCDACKQVQIGCATGIDCECFYCTRPDYARFELDFTYIGEAELYTSNCQGVGGYYCIRNCGIQDRYDNLYNGTIILQKYRGETIQELGFYAPAFGEYCGDFGYYFYHVYDEFQFPAYFGGPPVSPLLLVTVNPTLVQITYTALESVPCGPLVVWCASPISYTISYVRNKRIRCEDNLIEYKIKNHSYATRVPRTITLETFDL